MPPKPSLYIWRDIEDESWKSVIVDGLPPHKVLQEWTTHSRIGSLEDHLDKAEHDYHNINWFKP